MVADNVVATPTPARLPAHVAGRHAWQDANCEALLGSRLGRRDLLVSGRHGRFTVPSAHEPIGFHLLVDGARDTKCWSARVKGDSPCSIRAILSRPLGDDVRC